MQRLIKPAVALNFKPMVVLGVKRLPVMTLDVGRHAVYAGDPGKPMRTFKAQMIFFCVTVVNVWMCLVTDKDNGSVRWVCKIVLSS